jgi:hypothetical protein
MSLFGRVARIDEKKLIDRSGHNKDLTLPDRFDQRIKGWAERGVRVLLAFSENDEGLPYFRRIYGHSFEKLAGIPGVSRPAGDLDSCNFPRRRGGGHLGGADLPLGTGGGVRGFRSPDAGALAPVGPRDAAIGSQPERGIGRPFGGTVCPALPRIQSIVPASAPAAYV